MAARRIRLVAGVVVRVELGEGWIALGRVVERTLVDFFEPFEFSGSELSDEVARRLAVPPIFRLSVMDSAIKSERWPVIAVVPLDAPVEPTVFFMQDALNGTLSLYWENRTTGESFRRPASIEECEELERMAVWSATHVEDRLRDHRKAVPNIWVESLRVKRLPPAEANAALSEGSG